MTAARRAHGRPAPGAVRTRPASDTLLTPAEVAAELRVTAKTLRNWRASTPRRGPEYVKAGGAVRYRRSAVDAFLNH